MIRQYFAQTRQGGDNPLGVGVIPVGAILYLRDDWWWRDRHRGAPILREPWIVTGFLNGTMAAARRNRDTGRWEDVFLARRSDMALVRSLRDGRRQRQVAVRLLILHEEEELTRQPVSYPSLPDLRFWHAARRHAPKETPWPIRTRQRTPKRTQTPSGAGCARAAAMTG